MNTRYELEPNVVLYRELANRMLFSDIQVVLTKIRDTFLKEIQPKVIKGYIEEYIGSANEVIRRINDLILKGRFLDAKALSELYFDDKRFFEQNVITLIRREKIVKQSDIDPQEIVRAANVLVENNPIHAWLYLYLHLDLENISIHTLMREIYDSATSINREEYKELIQKEQQRSESFQNDKRAALVLAAMYYQRNSEEESRKQLLRVFDQKYIEKIIGYFKDDMEKYGSIELNSPEYNGL